jgi:hypothetical protein
MDKFTVRHFLPGSDGAESESNEPWGKRKQKYFVGR